MQALPSHSQRQLVSGKVGWGWRQATYPICTNFGFAGILIMAIASAILLKWDTLWGRQIYAGLVFLGLIIGLYSARSIVAVCQNNSGYRFSQGQSLGMLTYLMLLAGGIERSPEAFVRVFVAMWWILPAATFLGISISLLLRSTQLQLMQKAKSAPEIKSAVLSNVLNSEALNVVTYSDHTVLVSPSALSQQPRQFNSLVLMTLGLCCWTMLDFAPSFKAIATISFTIGGLTGFFTWQAQLRSPDKLLQLKFSGLWGLAAHYVINLRPFSHLTVIKLQEANGELSWMQLAGGKLEITLPTVMTMFMGQSKEENQQSDQFGKAIREEFHLAKQETESDGLGLAHILLPQGAGILAGAVFIAIGLIVLLSFPIQPKLTSSSIFAWLGVCIVSPDLGKFLLQIVAPNSLQSDRQPQRLLHSWEIGVALILISLWLNAHNIALAQLQILNVINFTHIFPLFTLAIGWLCVGVGICILTFVRRFPLWNAN